MDCPKDIFERLWAVRGNGTDDQNCIEFAYEALCNYEFTGYYFLRFDNSTNETLKDWFLVEDWVQDLGVNLSLEDIFGANLQDLYSEDVLPCHIISNSNDLKELALKALSIKLRDDGIGIPGVACTKIVCDKRALYLIYHDLDGWSLGYEDFIHVFESLDHLKEESGYYFL
jgi:hypothetical protein